MKIKALTLWQPWATLMAMGEKKIETRSWATKYRGLLAIHSAKRKLTNAEDQLIIDWVRKHRIGLSIDNKAYPLGQVVCVVNLLDCIQQRFETKVTVDSNFESTATVDVFGAKNERLFGDYSIGRYAWITEMVWVSPYVTGYPAIGHQGLWNWEVHGYIQGTLQDWINKTTKEKTEC